MPVEVRLLSRYDVNLDQIRAEVESYLRRQESTILFDTSIEGWQEHLLLAQHVDHIRVGESPTGGKEASLASVDLIIDVYHVAPVEDVEELMAGDADGVDRGEDETMAATVLELPNASLEGIWENLFFDHDIKKRLLDYVQTSLLYSKAKVDPNIIALNRLILLHGPPGTGKTSLGRALAQKLTIQLSRQFAYGKLVEINSHSLFSKWFSESGKLVQKLFSMIMEMVADPDALIVVLIDEVESLTAAREAASSGSEPGDAVRVVNALLTQLDKLKQRSNVLVITTSNLPDTIDNAFLDRADLKEYIGLPSSKAVLFILRTACIELFKAGLLQPQPISSLLIEDFEKEGESRNPLISSTILSRIQTMSARELRRLPLLAHARYIGPSTHVLPVPWDVWVDAMLHAVQSHFLDKKNHGYLRRESGLAQVK